MKQNNHSRTILPRTVVRDAVALAIFATIAVLPSIAHAQQTWSFDPTFQRTPLRVTSESASGVLVLQSGKVLIHTINGDPLSGANGKRVGALIRVDPDTGAIDPTWNPDPRVTASGFLGVAEAPDGKIYYSTSLANEGATGPADPLLNRLIRLNADGSRDTSFNSPIFVNVARFLAVQPDGKVIVGSGGVNQGPGFVVPGSITQTVRLNTDGSVDTNFQSPTFQSTANGSDVGVFGDPLVDPQTGKIYFCGSFRFVNGQPRKGIVRVNPDGTLDPSFVPTGLVTGNTSITGRAMVLQPDGKVVLGGTNLLTAAGGFSNRYELLRFRNDGTVDPDFTLVPTPLSSFGNSTLGPHWIRAQPDGKILTTGFRVRRFLPDGGVDSTFARLDYASSFHEIGNLGAYRMDIDRVTGAAFFASPPPLYTRLGGIQVGNVTKLRADGTIDTDFASPVVESENFQPDVQIGPDGAVFVSGAHTDFGGAPNASISRLRPDGTRDSTYSLGTLPFPDKQAASFALLADGAGYALYHSGSFNGSYSFSNLVRLSPTGAVEPSFRLSEEFQTTYGIQAFDGNEFLPPDSGFEVGPAPNDGVYLFTTGSPQNTVNVDGKVEPIRIKADGTKDPDAPGLGFPTGEVIRGSSGLLYGGSTGYLHRLASTADGGFIVLASVALPTNTGAPYGYRVIKLRPDGTADTSFGEIPVTSTLSPLLNYPVLWDPVTQQTLQPPSGFFQAADQPVTGATLLPDGSVILAGNFRVTGEQPSYSVAKFTSAGVRDATFSLPTVENRLRPGRRAVVTNLRVAPGGKLWMCGRFDTVNGIAAPGVARLHPDGNVDTTFQLTGVEYYDYTGDAADVVFADATTAYLVGTFRRSGEPMPFAITRIRALPQITSPRSAAGMAGRQFTYQFEASGATSRNVSGLPSGLSYNDTIRAIVGIPTTPGTFSVVLSASNANGTTNETLALTIQAAPASGPVIASGTAATGRTGSPFTFQVFTSGGTSAARLSAVNLPPGLTLDPVTGVISGIPTTDGSFAVELTVTDGAAVATSTVQLTFSSDPALPVIISPGTATLSIGQQFFYQVVAPTTAGPDDPMIFSMISTLPDGLVFDPIAGTISGVLLNNGAEESRGTGPTLSGRVITNVQLFATNSHGTTTIPLIFFLRPPGVANISTRLSVGGGDDVLIGGFIVTGNAPKKVIIRAIAPSLSVGGVPVPGTLPDPTLELVGSGLSVINDDWRETQESEIIASTVAPTDEREAALVATLNPGNYTAIVRGKNGATGISLVEVYDLGTATLESSSSAKLANISTRGSVQTADNVMIGGFIISGASSRVIVRAIGPDLTVRGVAGALQDTTLELHGPGGLIATNDDWESTQRQDIIDSTVPPNDPRESAIVANLPPGGYTAIVRGKDGSTGVALVEVFTLQ